MTRKKKIIIIVTVIVIILLLLIGAIVAIVAASQSSIKSNISVNYYATDISADISASVIGSDGTRTAMVNKDDNNNELISFNNLSTNLVATGSLEPTGTIELDTNSRYVVFEFKFENKSKAYELIVSSSLPTMSGDTMAYTVSYLVTKNQITENYQTEISQYEVSSLVLGSEEIGYVYAIVKVTNTGDDTDFALQFSWDLVQGDALQASE